MVYELKLKVHVNEDVHFTRSLSELGDWLKAAFSRDESLSELHGSRGYKGIVYSNLIRSESDGVYKRGVIYTWRIRGVSSEMLKKIQRVLKSERGGMFTYISGKIIEFEVSERGVIEKLKTVNPLIMNGIGKSMDDFNVLEVMRAIEGNMEKKYRDFVGGDVRGHSFISRIEVVTRKPTALPYKGIKLLGFQYVIYVKEDDLSQAYAELALSTGLGEKNASLGAGFVNAVLYDVTG